MKITIPISSWQTVHAAVPLHHAGGAPAIRPSAYDGQSARSVDSVEGEALLHITLRARPSRPAAATPEQVRKALRPPWWA
jgi:hypothetical protein